MTKKHKPIERQIAEGDPRKHGKHKLEQKLARIPHPSGGLPVCPKHLGGRARECWEHWADELSAMQLDAKCDAEMLEGACVAYARAVKADLQIEKQGAVIYEPVLVRGKIHPTITRLKKHPAVTVSTAAWVQVHRFCSEFGLSPASRVRLAVAPVTDSAVDVETLLSGPLLTAEEKQKLN